MLDAKRSAIYFRLPSDFMFFARRAHSDDKWGSCWLAALKQCVGNVSAFCINRE